MGEKQTYHNMLIKIGQAMARWQVVEYEVRELFLDLLDCRSRDCGAAVFHSVETFRSKLSMARAVVEMRLMGSPLAKEWKTLAADLEKKSETRNKLAHWTYVATFKQGSPGDATYRIIPPIGDMREKMANKQITLNDLDQVIMDFSIIQNYVRLFRQKVANFQAPPQTPP